MHSDSKMYVLVEQLCACPRTLSFNWELGTVEYVVFFCA